MITDPIRKFCVITNRPWVDDWRNNRSAEDNRLTSNIFEACTAPKMSHWKRAELLSNLTDAQFHALRRVARCGCTYPCGRNCGCVCHRDNSPAVPMFPFV